VKAVYELHVYTVSKANIQSTDRPMGQQDFDRSRRVCDPFLNGGKWVDSKRKKENV
jgi:hypothetical protein